MSINATTSSASTSSAVSARDIQAKKENLDYMKEHFDRKISREIESYGNKKNFPKKQILEKSYADFRGIVKHFMPRAKIIALGSFACGVDIGCSDLDLSLDDDEQKDPGAILKKLRICLNDKSWNRYTAFLLYNRFNLLKVRDTRLNVDIDVTVNNSDAKRNTAILQWYSDVDDRFAVLCKAIKDWGKHAGVINSREERINSLSLCFMLINYLQVGVSPPVLPCIQKELPDLNGEIEIPNNNYSNWDIKKRLEAKGVTLGENKSSLAALFIGFFKYYADFDFKKNMISIKEGVVLEKRDSDNNLVEKCPKMECFVTVVDPFIIQPWNCSATLKEECYFIRFQQEFKNFGEQIVKFSSIFIDRQSLNLRRMINEGKEKDMEKSNVWLWIPRLVFGENYEEYAKLYKIKKASEFWDAALQGNCDLYKLKKRLPDRKQWEKPRYVYTKEQIDNAFSGIDD